MPPRKKPISQLAESTKKKNPSRVAKRAKQPLIISGALQVPSHFDKELRKAWTEVVESYPGLDGRHKHLVEIAANALLRSRSPNAKSSELAFLHRITNQLQQAAIDYTPCGTASAVPSTQAHMTWELYEIRNKQRAEQLNAGTLSEAEYTQLEEADAALLTDEEEIRTAQFFADEDVYQFRETQRRFAEKQPH